MRKGLLESLKEDVLWEMMIEHYIILEKYLQ
jgi:hypothetical protein